MINNKVFSGHIAAFITILIWGTTFISTKILLDAFTPIEILFIRFLIGYLILCVVYPRRLILSTKKQELYFVAAGLCGVTLYYLFENIALTYTSASNVGVIISIAPFFTALFDSIFFNSKRLTTRFILGFAIAMIGVSLISFNGKSILSLNMKGDILAMVAAVLWAIYSTLTKKISAFGYNTIQTTRHTFFYGLLFMIPTLFMTDLHISITELSTINNILNLLFLGLGASALCFVTWNFAVKILGSVKTSVYIYMVPVITTITSFLLLHEDLTVETIWGIIFTLIGLSLSESTGKKKVYTMDMKAKDI